MSDDPLEGGNWWKMYDGPGYRSAFSPIGRYSCLDHMYLGPHHRLPPLQMRCAWSLEICREEARKAAWYQQLEEAIAQDDARREARRAARLEAEARYREQRRQALAAILAGLLVVDSVQRTIVDGRDRRKGGADEH